MICCVSKLVCLRRLAVAELVNHVRLDRVLAAPVAEDVPGDLRRTLDEEGQAPDVRVVVAEYRRREEDGAPPKREAPESKDLRARFPVVCPPAAGGADPDDHGPQRLEAVVGGQGPVESVYGLHLLRDGDRAAPVVPPALHALHDRRDTYAERARLYLS